MHTCFSFRPCTASLCRLRSLDRFQTIYLQTYVENEIAISETELHGNKLFEHFTDNPPRHPDITFHFYRVNNSEINERCSTNSQSVFHFVGNEAAEMMRICLLRHCFFKSSITSLCRLFQVYRFQTIRSDRTAETRL